METRIAYLETKVSNLQEDIRELRKHQRDDFRFFALGALIAVTLGLVGIMSKGFGWL